MQELATLILKVAPHDCSDLVLGESGTGQELRARSIQENPKRAKGPFMPLNCGAMPDTHVKVDVRVIAATKRDFKSMIAEGIFRQDLVQHG